MKSFWHVQKESQTNLSHFKVAHRTRAVNKWNNCHHRCDQYTTQLHVEHMHICTHTRTHVNVLIYKQKHLEPRMNAPESCDSHLGQSLVAQGKEEASSAYDHQNTYVCMHVHVRMYYVSQKTNRNHKTIIICTYVQYASKKPVRICAQSRVAAVHINPRITLRTPTHVD